MLWNVLGKRQCLESELRRCHVEGLFAGVNQIRVILPFGLCIRSANQQRPQYIVTLTSRLTQGWAWQPSTSWTSAPRAILTRWTVLKALGHQESNGDQFHRCGVSTQPLRMHQGIPLPQASASFMLTNTEMGHGHLCHSWRKTLTLQPMVRPT